MAETTADHWAGKSVENLAANWVYSLVEQRVDQKAVQLVQRWAAWRVA